MSHQLKWLGHSAFMLTTVSGKVILIDPWLEGNPKAPIGIKDLPKADLVLVTHDHGDHAGDVPAVIEQTGATLVAQPEVCGKYHELGVPKERIVTGMGMNIGGTVQFGDISVTMVDAYHSSATGEPAGYIITLEDGKVLYHAGDTGLHANMKTWGELFDIDLALLPIGDHFTMGGRQAAIAAGWLKAKKAQPMHYLTFPLLAQSAEEFTHWAAQSAPDTQIVVVEPGEETLF